MVGFNDSLSEEEAVKRAMAISLEDSVSSSGASGASGGDAISRMTEEEQMRRAIEDSLKSAETAEVDVPTRTHGKELGIQGSAKRWAPGCVNAAGNAQAVLVSNSRRKIYQTWIPPFSRALYNQLYNNLRILRAHRVVEEVGKGRGGFERSLNGVQDRSDIQYFS